MGTALVIADDRMEQLREHWPEDIKIGYEWYSEQNESDARQAFDGLWMAARFHGGNQIDIYKKKLLDLYHKDHVDRVHDLVKNEPGYGHDGIYFHWGPWDEKVERTFITFDGVSLQVDVLPRKVKNIRQDLQTVTRGNDLVEQYIEYVPWGEYGREVPVDAMRALTLLEWYGIQPEAIWVGKYMEKHRPLKDPLLSVSFGYWMVSIAVWF